jgi:hypothetical protein
VSASNGGMVQVIHSDDGSLFQRSVCLASLVQKRQRDALDSSRGHRGLEPCQVVARQAMAVAIVPVSSIKIQAPGSPFYRGFRSRILSTS